MNCRRYFLCFVNIEIIVLKLYLLIFVFEDPDVNPVPECLSTEECNEVGTVSTHGICVPQDSVESIRESVQNAVSTVGDRIKEALKKIKNRFRFR